jgi:hypothetical protein
MGVQSKQGDAWKYLTTWTPAPTAGNSSGGLPSTGLVPPGTVGGSGNAGSAGTIDIPPGIAIPEIPGVGGEPRVELSHPSGSAPDGTTANTGGGVTSGTGTWIRQPGEVKVNNGMVPTQYDVVPVPPAALLGLAGLGGVGLSGWLRRRAR